MSGVGIHTLRCMAWSCFSFLSLVCFLFILGRGDSENGTSMDIGRRWFMNRGGERQMGQSMERRSLCGCLVGGGLHNFPCPGRWVYYVRL